MLIVCPSCATTYSLTEAQLGQGRTLRCAQCRHTWHATPADAVADEAALAALPEPSLAHADPAHADLAHADLAHADLAHADISHGDLAGADPAHADGPGPKAAGAPRAAHGRHPPKGRKGAGRPPHRRPKPGGAGMAGLVGRLKAAKPWQWALAGAALALVAAIVLREPVVRMAPQTARLFAAIGLPVNLRGLAFDGVRSEVIADKDQTVLIVEGTIRNVRKRDTTVPALSLSLRGEDGGEVYSWTADAPHSVLAPGESTPFRTRVVTPPLDGREILVRFARNDDTAPTGH